MLCLELRYLVGLLSFLALMGAMGANVEGEAGAAVGYLLFGGLVFGVFWTDLEKKKGWFKPKRKGERRAKTRTKAD